MTRRDPAGGGSRSLPDLGRAGAAAGLLCVALFPVIGNALAFPDSLVPRRFYQLRALVVAALLLFLGRGWLVPPGRGLAALPWKPAARWSAAAALLVAAQATATMAWGGARLSPAMVAELLLFLPWLAFSALVLAGPRRSWFTGRRSEADGAARDGMLFGGIAAAIGYAVLARGWWRGGGASTGLLAYGGSPIVTGTAAVAGFYMVLACVRFPLSLACALPYGCLLIMSTSRTALWGACLLYVPFAVRALREPAAPWRRWTKVLFLPALLGTLILVPMLSAKPLAALYRAFDRDPREAAYARTQYLDRLYRNFRLLPSGTRAWIVRRERGALGIPDGVSDAALLDAYTRRFAGLSDREHRLFRLLEQPREDRAELYPRSLALIARRPQGHFPVPFDTVIGMDCGNGIPCGYPHNVFLGAGYYFGWIPSLVLLAGLLTAAAAMLTQFLGERDLLRQLAIVGFGSGFVFMQFSGDFSDYLGTLVFGILWVVSRPRRGRS